MNEGGYRDPVHRNEAVRISDGVMASSRSTLSLVRIRTYYRKPGGFVKS